jgi:carbamoyltransferase
MLVLGINEDHNGSAALLQDGKVIACASEERFTGWKNDIGYPREAIEWALGFARVRASDCDRIVYSTLAPDPLNFKVKRITRFKITDYVREMYEHWKPLLYEKRTPTFWDDIQNDPRLANPEGVHYNFEFMKRTPRDEWETLFNRERKRVVCEHLGVPADRVGFVDHHTAHAYYAYHAAPISHARKTAVVTADGWGDGCNATISVAQGNHIKEIFRTSRCHLARIYRWTTLILGMKPYEHEYKVMGLAPYAKSYITAPAYKIFKETLRVDGLDFKWKIQPPDMYFYFREQFEKHGARFDGIAGALQQWVEELLTEWVGNIMDHLKAEDLVFSGGVAMNVKANKALAGLPQVKDFFVAPSPGDESISMGAAMVVAHEQDRMQPLRDAYLGSAPDADEVEAALAAYNASGRFQVRRQPTPDDIAELWVAGKVIARCVGRMEFGARALGNRSILCNPANWEQVAIINEKIKGRDFWMPFTPSILFERADDYIVNPKRLKAPYMTVCFDSTPLARQQLKAAIHPYDFTVRPQLVEQTVNPEYYALIKAFERRTGIGAILNTSLNLHGKPIVRTAFDAFDTFVNSGLDGLLLPGVLVLKPLTA